MSLSELEEVGRAVTQLLNGRDDAAVGAGLALYQHSLIDQEPKDLQVNVYGSNDAFAHEPRLDDMLRRGLIKYHQTDLEFRPSVKNGIQVLALEDSIVLQAKKVASGEVFSYDLAYLADIHAKLGPRGIDTLLASSRLAAKVPSDLETQVRKAGHSLRLNSIAQKHLRSLGDDLILFSAVSAAAENRSKSNRAIRENEELRNQVPTRPDLMGRLWHRSWRKSEGKARETAEKASELGEIAVSFENEFMELAQQRFETIHPGLRNWTSGIRREGLPEPSPSYESAYVKIVSKALSLYGDPRPSTQQPQNQAASQYGARHEHDVVERPARVAAQPSDPDWTPTSRYGGIPDTTTGIALLPPGQGQQQSYPFPLGPWARSLSPEPDPGQAPPPYSAAQPQSGDYHGQRPPSSGRR